jgi:hypothetical protein
MSLSNKKLNTNCLFYFGRKWEERKNERSWGKYSHACWLAKVKVAAGKSVHRMLCPPNLNPFYHEWINNLALFPCFFLCVAPRGTFEFAVCHMESRSLPRFDFRTQLEYIFFLLLNGSLPRDGREGAEARTLLIRGASTALPPGHRRLPPTSSISLEFVYPFLEGYPGHICMNWIMQ